jgi:uncharacterized protein
MMSASESKRGETFLAATAESITEFDEAEWDAFAGAEGGNSSPFVRHAWLRCLEESGCVSAQRGWQSQHLSIRDNVGKLLALVPMYAKFNSEGEFVFDYNFAQAAHSVGLEWYPKLVIGVPFTPASGRRILTLEGGAARESILDSVAQALITICERLKVSSANVNFCSVDEANALKKNGFFMRVGVQYQWHNRASCGVRFADFDCFLASMKSSTRIKVKRERRRVRESGLQICVLSGHEISDELIVEMYAVYKSTIDKQGPYGRLYLSKLFFELLAEAKEFRRFLTFCVAKNESGQLVAGTFNLCSDSVFYGRYWGIHPEFELTGKYRSLHFELSYYCAMAYVIERGLVRMEPGAGGGEFKERRGYAPTRTFSMHYVSLRNGRLRDAIEHYCAAECLAIEREIFYSAENK